jgi:hypothetical protein
MKTAANSLESNSSLKGNEHREEKFRSTKVVLLPGNKYECDWIYKLNMSQHKTISQKNKI